MPEMTYRHIWLYGQYPIMGKVTEWIRNGEIQYEADADAIRQANEAKADAEYNKIVHDLEKQIDNLTEERDSLL